MMTDHLAQDECDIATFREELATGKSLLLLDVRNAQDFENSRIELEGLRTQNLPYDDLLADGWKAALKLPKQEIVVVCYRGRTSAIVTSHLKELGLKARSLTGGMKAWSKVYDITPITTAPELTIYQISRVGRGCLSYLIASNDEAFIIDPTRHLEHYFDLVKKLTVRVKAIIETHAHADHLSGGRALSETFSVPYCIHPEDTVHPIDQTQATFLYTPLTNGQKLNLGTIQLEVLHLPGHTLGTIALLADEKYLFSGDTLFLDSISRPDLGGQLETWTALHHTSMQKLHALSDKLILLPGHFSKSPRSETLGVLKETNATFKLAKLPLSEFSAALKKGLSAAPSAYLEIKRANLGLITPTDDEASKLELGKNECSIL